MPGLSFSSEGDRHTGNPGGFWPFCSVQASLIGSHVHTGLSLLSRKAEMQRRLGRELGEHGLS